MVLRKESDIAINLFREFKIEQGSKLRVENELQLKSTMEFINQGGKNNGKTKTT